MPVIDRHLGTIRLLQEEFQKYLSKMDPDSYDIEGTLIDLEKKLKGVEGEIAVLKILSRYHNIGIIHHDDFLPQSNGKPVQIDHIFLCPYGIFVIETKNWSNYKLGLVKGGEMFKPVKQARTAGNLIFHHLKNTIEEDLGKKCKTLEFLIFTGGTPSSKERKSMEEDEPRVRVMHRTDFEYFLEREMPRMKKIYTKKDLLMMSRSLRNIHNNTPKFSEA